MDFPVNKAAGTAKRRRRWARWVLWALAVLLSIASWSQVAKSATFPRAVAEHPVRTEATVTSLYINGLGGDPGVEYKYSVGGHSFTGSGDGRLGGESMPLQRGEKVAIEYAASQPSESCTCDAAQQAPPSTETSILTAAGLTLPLLVLVGRTVPGLARTRQSWFEPVRGWEWLPFVLGILLAAVVGVLFLAYLIAPSVEGWSP
jgi:hypothetical protein